jgi:AP-1 complex subunit beta-1
MVLMQLHPEWAWWMELVLQVAMKTNQLGVFYWDDDIPMVALLEDDGTIDGQTFLTTWRSLAQEVVQKLPLAINDIEAAKAQLQAVNLFVLAHRPVSA